MIQERVLLRKEELNKSKDKPINKKRVVKRKVLSLIDESDVREKNFERQRQRIRSAFDRA